MTKYGLKEKYVGMTNVNSQGYKMTIVDYISSKDIVVEFDDVYKTQKHCALGNFKKGHVSNRNHPTVFGFGIVGVDRKNLANEKEYLTWTHMIQRCYIPDEHRRVRDSAYKDCVVCEEWRMYSCFYDWIRSQENYKQWLDGGFSIDKDIIKKGNNVYCPEYCCLVPNYINNIFTKHTAKRGKYPIGVSINIYGTFTVCVKDYETGKNKHYGNFDTPEEAFSFYKEKKEEYIKRIAQEEYDKGNIVEKCYNAMMNYQIEITD